MKENKLNALLPLGAGLVMASSADVRAALGMGGAVIAVLLLSSMVMFALRKLIPAKGYMPMYLLVVTGFVSLTGMIMQAYFPTAANLLGVHLAALAVTAVPFSDAAEAAGKGTFGKTVLSALLTGLCFLGLLVVTAAIREVLGSASFFGMPISFLADYRISTLAGIFGGYLVLALVLAVCNALAATRNKEDAQV